MLWNIIGREIYVNCYFEILTQLLRLGELFCTSSSVTVFKKGEKTSKKVMLLFLTEILLRFDIQTIINNIDSDLTSS